MMGRPVGVTKGYVAESRTAVLTAISAQYRWVNSVSPISPCVIGTVEMANRCPVSTMVELNISAGRLGQFCGRFKFVVETFAPLSFQDASAIVANISNEKWHEGSPKVLS